jgi:hypothetical protein
MDVLNEKRCKNKIINNIINNIKIFWYEPYSNKTIVIDGVGVK